MAANGIGILSKCYYRSTGSFGSPTWTELTIIRDLTLNDKWDIADVFTRATRAKKGVPTMLDVGMTGTVRCLADNTLWLAMRTAWLAGTVFDILALTGAKDNNGEVGWRYEAVIEDMGTPQGSGDALYSNFAWRPHGESTNAVQSVAVSTGAPVLTSFV